jgi:hypothetical protein
VFASRVGRDMSESGSIPSISGFDYCLQSLHPFVSLLLLHISPSPSRTPYTQINCRSHIEYQKGNSEQQIARWYACFLLLDPADMSLFFLHRTVNRKSRSVTDLLPERHWPDMHFVIDAQAYIRLIYATLSLSTTRRGFRMNTTSESSSKLWRH